ncbi:MAG: ribonuclease H family protein [Raineya sp.]|nr:ribonuclease H family protein [Raineya sp.]
MAQKYYVVWEGRSQGIYESWQDCKAQVDGFKGAKYKSFEKLEEAQKAFTEPFEKHIGKKTSPQLPNNLPYAEFLCVDAACNMQTGEMEYRGVHYPSGKVVFHQKNFQDATNNMGEFLAIVHALAHLKKQNSQIPVFTDSTTALNWLKQKKCRTERAISEKNKPVFELIRRAEEWLQNNAYENPVLKWETDKWGEIPADFGRK